MPYSILTGIAISKDLREFKRINNTPALERNDLELNLRSAPTVVKHKRKYVMIYVSSLGWKSHDNGFYKNKLLPTYCLRLTTSSDGISWNNESKIIMRPNTAKNEFGFGRPYLFEYNLKYYFILFY